LYFMSVGLYNDVHLTSSSLAAHIM
jgi:hypothetical protein